MIAFCVFPRLVCIKTFSAHDKSKFRHDVRKSGVFTHGKNSHEGVGCRRNKNHSGMEIKTIVDITGALLAPIICAILFGDWNDDKDKPM